MKAFNVAATYAAFWAFEQWVFNQQSSHKRCYDEVRKRFFLSAQMAKKPWVKP